jgi:hypothetical protein
MRTTFFPELSSLLLGACALSTSGGAEDRRWGEVRSDGRPLARSVEALLEWAFSVTTDSEAVGGWGMRSVMRDTDALFAFLLFLLIARGGGARRHIRG